MAIDNTSQGWSYDYVSTLEPLLEAYNISQEIYRAYGDQKYNAYMLIKELGWQKEVDQVKFHHFEEKRKLQTVLVDTTATAAGAGQQLVVDLDATNFVNGKTYIRENFTITFPDLRKAWVKDVDINNQQITLVPFDSTYTISVTAGQEYAVGGSAFGEGTGQPVGMVRSYTLRTAYTQIFKENSTATGTAMTNRASVDVKRLADYIKSAPAELGNTLVATCQADIDFGIAQQISDAIYFGEENNNAALIVSQDAAALGGDITSTKGINKTTVDLGSTENYPLTTLSIQNYYDIGDIMDREMVSPLTPLLYRMGRGQNVEREQLLLANQAMNFQSVYTKDQLNGKIFNSKAGKEVFFNYTDMTIGGYTFVSSIEPVFTDNRYVGAAGYNASNLAFIIPMTGGQDKDGKDLDAICWRWKKLGGFNRMFDTWSMDRSTNGGYDIKSWQLLSNGGCQFFGANRFVKLQGS